MLQSRPGDVVDCRFCGESFVSHSYGQRYCGWKCNKNALNREAEHPSIIKICKECQKEFKTIKYSAKFCSTYCEEMSKAKVKLEKWANHVPKKRKRQDCGMHIFFDMRDKPPDSALKRFNACRG